jgi:hypothetical protein
MSNLIRQRYEEGGNQEVVIDDWEAFGAEATRLDNETPG